MATPTTNSNVTRTISQTAQYVQEKWTREIQQPFDKELQMAHLVQDRSGLVADGGDILNIPFAIQVDARAKSGGTAITYDVPNGAPITLNIDKHYYVGVLIEDIAKIQASYDLRSAFQQRMAEGLARQVDTDLHALYASTGTDVSAGASVDDADILSVVYTFDTNNVPQSLRRGVVGHNSKTDMLGINKYVAYDQTGKTGVAVSASGEALIGSVYGMDLYHSGNVPTSTTGRNLFFHKNAISLAQQKAPTFEMEYSVDYIGWKTVLHTIYGVGVERSTALIGLTRTTAP
jgi:hypothetical protein